MTGSHKPGICSKWSSVSATTGMMECRKDNDSLKCTKAIVKHVHTMSQVNIKYAQTLPQPPRRCHLHYLQLSSQLGLLSQYSGVLIMKRMVCKGTKCFVFKSESPPCHHSGAAPPSLLLLLLSHSPFGRGCLQVDCALT